MDVTVREELNSTIESLTHSGSSTLNQSLINKVKRICRQSDINLRTTYDIVMSHLSKTHAEVRLSAFQVVSELFTRSHLFRELLIADFQRFVKLVTETDSAHPLPPPKLAAAQLKEKSLLAIREWNERFGEGYPKLKLAYNYLKFNKKVNFDQLVAQSEAAQRRQQERETRRRVIQQQKVQEIKQEMIDLKPDIEGCLTEMNSCFNLLLPRFDIPDLYSYLSPEDSTSESNAILSKPQQPLNKLRRRTDSSSSFHSITNDESDGESITDDQPSHTSAISAIDQTSDSLTENKSVIKGKERINLSLVLASSTDDPCCHDINTDEESDDSEVEWEDVISYSATPYSVDTLELQEHGFASHGFSIPVEVNSQPEIYEDGDNSSILSTLRECKYLLSDKYVPAIIRWMEWMTKAGEDAELRSIIDLKRKVMATLDKFGRLKIVHNKEQFGEKDDQSDSPQPNKKPVVTHSEWIIRPSLPAVDLALDPTTPEAQLAKLKKIMPLGSGSTTGSVSTSASVSSKTEKQKLLEKAPLVTFGMDLYNWGNTSEVQPTATVSVGSLHRFWVEEREVDINEDEKKRLNCRTINFAGNFQPIEKSCQAPLPSGRLCPRKDRFKCPFHGPIIPRDEQGNPVANSSTLPGSSREPAPSLPPANSSSNSTPLWQDSELQADIMAATGVKLNLEKKKRVGRKKANKYPGLTDLKVHTDTPRKRLERKVLSKRSLKRVANDMDATTAKKYRDKFGYNFNYALSS